MAGLLPNRRSKAEILRSNEQLIERNQAYLRSWTEASENRWDSAQTERRERRVDVCPPSNVPLTKTR